MHYKEPLYRPPSEAYSLIFQITLGCSFNQCSFCSMYRSKTFSEQPLEKTLADIERAARFMPSTRRVFLADGDALVRSTEDLLTILEALYRQFPALQRVSSYALPNNLIRKSQDELQQLRQAGLSLLYYGIESGSAEILKRITKGATPERMREGLDKAHAAGMQVSATVVLGLGGQQLWQEHIDGTVALVNQLQLDFLSTLQLTLEHTVRDEFYEKFERRGSAFIPQNDAGILEEQYRLIEGLNPASPVVFRSNHASNALPLKGNLPQDRDRILAMLDAARHGKQPLRPSWMRGL